MAVCSHCREAGRAQQEVEAANGGSATRTQLKRIDQLHRRCKSVDGSNTHCDCQHRTDKARPNKGNEGGSG